MNFDYANGSSEFFDTIQPLWEQLNQHHEKISLHFKEDFCNNTFEQRKAYLKNCYQPRQLHFDLAYYNDALVGYCISGIRDDGIGEIESIFVIKKYRSRNVGYTLLQHALEWLERQGATSKVIDVAIGNEQALKFYARFGFLPRVTTLKQKDIDLP